eukprot:TRINITY_DN75772_c0_g1_i1.p1 TRINITY_DN75772_c0_g1~~TRINITY_DN75772_c0_g1_i1.p1  ORF type:complete len:427 (+),score=57.69 TRINITY_DN75772_c0_g1_i1:72-1352(+)
MGLSDEAVQTNAAVWLVVALPYAAVLLARLFLFALATPTGGSAGGELPRLRAAAAAAAKDAASTQRPWSDHVIMVTADNRKPRANVTPEEATFFEWAALANLAYAQRHGYDYRYFHYVGNDGCAHPQYGTRHWSWCKLLPVAAMLESVSAGGYTGPSRPTVFWVDSDAAIQYQTWSLPEFINCTGLGCGRLRYPGQCRTADDSVPKNVHYKNSASMLFFQNHFFCLESACGAAFLVRGTSRGRKLLSHWWNLPICRQKFPWEQRALNDVMFPLFHGEGGIEVLATKIDANPRPDGASYLQTHGHTGDPLTRVQSLRQVYKNAGLDETGDFARLLAELPRHIVEFTRQDMDAVSQSLTGSDASVAVGDLMAEFEHNWNRGKMWDHDNFEWNSSLKRYRTREAVLSKGGTNSGTPECVFIGFHPQHYY